jgi:hypothetical protein
MSTEIDLTPQEMEALQRATTRLERLLDASSKFVRYVMEPPVPGSPMAEAFKDPGLRDPYQMAHLLIISAEDHFGAILQIRSTQRLPKFALYTLLRAAGEAAVRCRYLLDPKLSGQDRLARALNERLDNIREARKDPAMTEAYYQKRLKFLEDKAIANGIEPIPEKRKTGEPGPTTAFGEQRKSATQLFTDYLPAGSKAFRSLSGFTHSRPWVQLRPELAQPSTEPGVSEMPLDLDVGEFLEVLANVVDLHDENIRLWLAAAGYPGDIWSTAKK